MRNLFETLEHKKKRRTPFSKSEEYSFYMANHSVLAKIPRFSFLDNQRDDFNIMRANIIINSYLNKTAFEEEMLNLETYIKRGENIDHIKIVQTIRERMIDKPYFKDEKDKIYIPFFSRTLNQLYNYEPEKLLAAPYRDLKENFAESVIDPFEMFGSELFNSNFTRLLKVEEKNEMTAYFHYDTFTIYFINSQGRLDNKIVLFDKYIRRPSYSHMVDRIKPVIEAYLAYDRTALLNALHDQGLISSKLLYQIHRKDRKK